MANTFILISSVTVGAGGTTEINFNSIPQTYTDLVVLISARQSTAGYYDGMNMKFNNNTSSWTERFLDGNGSVTSTSTDNLNRSLIVPLASMTTSTFSNIRVNIFNYTSSLNKLISADSIVENQSSTAGRSFMRMAGGSWANSAAITSIAIYNGANTFIQYSTAHLYGISNA